jgi:hypothetical protein
MNGKIGLPGKQGCIELTGKNSGNSHGVNGLLQMEIP